MPAVFHPASAVAPISLARLVYRAGFSRDDLVLRGREGGGWDIRLPTGVDKTAFRARDLAHMIKAYGLPCEILAGPGP